MAGHLTRELGLDINASNITEDQMRRLLSFSSMSEWHKDALIAQFIIGANGCEIDVTEDVYYITGKPARSFTQFAREYKSQFLNPHH